MGAGKFSNNHTSSNPWLEEPPETEPFWISWNYEREGKYYANEIPVEVEIYKKVIPEYKRIEYLEKTREKAFDVYNYLWKEFEIVNIEFSGNRSFYFWIKKLNPYASLDFEILQKIFQYIVDHTGVNIDMTIYEPNRLIGVVNHRHYLTFYKKVELEKNEFFECPINEILNKSRLSKHLHNSASPTSSYYKDNYLQQSSNIYIPNDPNDNLEIIREIPTFRSKHEFRNFIYTSYEFPICLYNHYCKKQVKYLNELKSCLSIIRKEKHPSGSFFVSNMNHYVLFKDHARGKAVNMPQLFFILEKRIDIETFNIDVFNKYQKDSTYKEIENFLQVKYDKNINEEFQSIDEKIAKSGLNSMLIKAWKCISKHFITNYNSEHIYYYSVRNFSRDLKVDQGACCKILNWFCALEILEKISAKELKEKYNIGTGGDDKNRGKRIAIRYRIMNFTTKQIIQRAKKLKKIGLCWNNINKKNLELFKRKLIEESNC